MASLSKVEVKIYLAFIVSFLCFSCSLYKQPHKSKVASWPKFTKADSLHGTLHENRMCYDVTYYDCDFKIDPSKKNVAGSVKLFFDAKLPVRRMQIDLAEKMEIDSILDNNGQKLAFSREFRAVTIKMKNLVMIGGKSMIHIFFHGRPKVASNPPWKGGMVWKKKKGKWFCGVACEDDGASIWWPCKDHIKDKPDSIQVRYTIPEGHMCVANGKLIAHQKTFDGWEKFTWRTSYPINIYNVSFYIGDYEQFEIPYSNSGSKLKAITAYVLKENLDRARKHFQQAIDILKIYESLFGPYPWHRDGYKLVESPYEGMEHQTAIAYGSKFKNEKYIDYDYIILHETAHEWWGNYVTACDLSDMWIHEGFATYAELLYEERVYGVEQANLTHFVNCALSKNKRPLVGPRGVYYTNFRDNDIYYKGAVVLHMLRKTIGEDELFFSIIKKFATNFGKQCVYTEHLMAVVNEETNENYDWFFQQYAFRAEAPELLYYFEQDTFKFKWNTECTNKDFALPINVSQGEFMRTIHPTDQVQKVLISDSTISSLTFDQDDFVIFKEIKSL